MQPNRETIMILKKKIKFWKEITSYKKKNISMLMLFTCQNTVKAYQKEGIDISMIQFQNEPYSRQQWPTCLWTPDAMRNFIANHLGPLFKKKLPDVELWLGTLNCNRMEDVNLVMSDLKLGNISKVSDYNGKVKILLPKYIENIPK